MKMEGGGEMLFADESGFGMQSDRNAGAYALSDSDHTTINVIKHLLKKDAYKELFTLDSHLLLLETMKRKFSVISAGETYNGLSNWGLREHIFELKDVISELRTLRERLFNSIM